MSLMDESMNQEGILATCSGEDVTKVELNEIKEHMVDVDAIISEEERQLVYESLIHENSHSAGHHPFFIISTDNDFEYPQNIIFIL
jgi:hypothetical protein